MPVERTAELAVWLVIATDTAIGAVAVLYNVEVVDGASPREAAHCAPGSTNTEPLSEELALVTRMSILDASPTLKYTPDDVTAVSVSIIDPAYPVKVLLVAAAA